MKQENPSTVALIRKSIHDAYWEIRGNLSHDLFCYIDYQLTQEIDVALGESDNSAIYVFDLPIEFPDNNMAYLIAKKMTESK